MDDDKRAQIVEQLWQIVAESDEAFRDKSLQVSALTARLAALKFIAELAGAEVDVEADPYAVEEQNAKAVSTWMQTILEAE